MQASEQMIELRLCRGGLATEQRDAAHQFRDELFKAGDARFEFHGLRHGGRQFVGRRADRRVARMPTQWQRGRRVAQEIPI